MNPSREGAIESIQQFTWYQFKAKFGSRQAKPKTRCGQEQEDKLAGPLRLNGTLNYLVHRRGGSLVCRGGNQVWNDQCRTKKKRVKGAKCAKWLNRSSHCNWPWHDLHYYNVLANVPSTYFHVWTFNWLKCVTVLVKLNLFVIVLQTRQFGDTSFTSGTVTHR